MKFVFFLSLIFFALNSFGAPCSGAPGKNHKNPDGTLGGFVAETANTTTTVFIDQSSSVCERSIVQGHAKIKSGSEISGTAIIEGNSVITSSKVKGLARVIGNSTITNSKVCQASEINFNVINSEYYCQTDDEEPKDPGELGRKTLLGIDSDVDGVRDDIEIWINNSTSNTKQKNNFNLRMALKQIARHLQLSNKQKDVPSAARESKIESLISFKCLQEVATPEEFENLKGNLLANFYNTMDRLHAYAKTEATLHGSSSIPNRKRNCAFNKK